MLTTDEIAELHPQVPEWEIVEVDSIRRSQRVFKLNNFVEALDFANKIGALAEEEDHHPMLIVEWGKVTVVWWTHIWWTHIIKGLHKNDFIMAAKTDKLFG